MVGVLKIAALSAVLAGAFVGLTEAKKGPDAASFLTERAAQARPVEAPQAPTAEGCGAAWPYTETCGTRAVRRIDLDRVHLRTTGPIVQAEAATRLVR